MAKPKIQDLPIVVEQRRTQTVGGQKLIRATGDILIDMRKQTATDVRNLVQLITVNEVAEQQGKLNNIASQVIVDNRPGKPLDTVYYKAVVVFGSLLRTMLMKQVEIELQRAITKTRYLTGALANVSHNWEWIYIPGKGKPPAPLPRNGDFMPNDARLILRPKLEHAGYATVINWKRGVSYQGPYPAAKGRSPRNRSEDGFMAIAAKRLRGSRNFKLAFSIYATMSKRNALPGNLYRHGAPVMVVRPSLGRAKRVAYKPVRK